MAAEVGHILEWYLPCWCCCCCGGGGGAAIVIDLTITESTSKRRDDGSTIFKPTYCLAILLYYSKLSGVYAQKNWLIEIPKNSQCISVLHHFSVPPTLLKSHENPGKMWDFSGISARKVAEHEDCLLVPQRGVPGPLCPWGRTVNPVDPAEPGVDPKAHPSYRNTWVNYSYTLHKPY